MRPMNRAVDSDRLPETPDPSIRMIRTKQSFLGRACFELPVD